MSGHSVLHSHGEAEWSDVECDRKIVRDCLQCCHCALQFYVTPGSGKRRGWCMNCAQATCGAEKCNPCLHWKKKLELIESGKAGMELISTGQTHHALPVSVSVTDAPPNEKKSPGGVLLS